MFTAEPFQSAGASEAGHTLVVRAGARGFTTGSVLTGLTLGAHHVGLERRSTGLRGRLLDDRL